MAGEAPAAGELIEVVAGVIRDQDGRVLLAQRPEGKHLAGSWEFPGGKREAGETGREALARELTEELGIAVGAARPWLALTHRYPEVTVRLQLYAVDEWRGSPHGREGQPLKWVEVDEMNRLPMPAADRPIVRAFGLADRYGIAPEAVTAQGFLAWARDSLERGVRLLQLPAASFDEETLAGLASDLDELVAGFGARWLLHGSPRLADELGAHGVHLDGEQLRGAIDRPLSGDHLVAASCRDESDLARAGELALDFVALAPERAGPENAPDWERFERLCRCSPLPVYALEELDWPDLERARELGIFGVGSVRFTQALA